MIKGNELTIFILDLCNKYSIEKKELVSTEVNSKNYTKMEICLCFKQLLDGGYIEGKNLSSYTDTEPIIHVFHITEKGNIHLKSLLTEDAQKTFKSWVKVNLIALISLIIAIFSMILSIIKK